MDEEVVIGLDFGNYYSYAFYIEGMDPKTHVGGNEWPLIRPSERYMGIPSFFYKEKGSDAVVGTKAFTSSNGGAKAIKLIKRNMGKSFSMGGETFTYQYAATMVVQHVIRQANNELQRSHHGLTTNKVSLACPVAIDNREYKLLVEAVEDAELEDGTKLEVVGTVHEPAAAALAYYCDELLYGADFAQEQQTVLVYDLGGGTFDASILALYPQGIEKGTETRYYDEVNKAGLSIGGQDFSDILQELITRLVMQYRNDPLNNDEIDTIRYEAERVKKELSEDEDCDTVLSSIVPLRIKITRAMFEDASKALLKQTIDCTLDIFKKYLNKNARNLDNIALWRPQKIVLTGGGSLMPMVKNELLKVFSKYGYERDDICIYQSSMAIAIGAARYPMKMHLSSNGVHRISNYGGAIYQYTYRDIGIRYVDGSDSANREHIATLIPKHSRIPFESEFKYSEPIDHTQQGSVYEVYQAKVENPDQYEIDGDWEYLGELMLEYSKRNDSQGSVVRKNQVRLVIDELELLHVEARERDRPETLCEIQIKWHNEGEGE